ncbi:MAG: 3-deoxy-D-manno-octulosonic acid transferase, partial [Prevotella sp.]|nr:3-deoxy-D-manno-octulosonic acid transferase [Prevotella sp.]
FVAGSSWPPDEDIFINFFNQHKDWKLIIAPHVIDDSHLEQILSKLDRKTIRYTQATPETAAQAECLLIDCFGLLSSIYHFGDVAYVGGGFGVGIHNVLEAAVWDIPVIFGPNNERFQEAQGLKAAGGGFDIASADDFQRIMTLFMNDEKSLATAGKKAGLYVQSLAGVTERIFHLLGFNKK